MTDPNTPESPAGATAADTPPKVLPDLPEGAALLKEGKIPYIPKERRLEEAPLMLGKAAWVLVAGSALPWYGHNGSWVTFGLAKAVILLGCFLFYASVVARTEAPVPAGLGGLGKMRWGPEFGAKVKSPKDQILSLVPTPLHLLAWVVTIVGFVMPLYDPAGAPIEIANGATEPSGFSALKALVEVGSLLLGAGTLVHIFAYKKGGSFNPLFPFLFLGPALAGVLVFIQTIAGVQIFEGLKPVQLLGSLLSAAAGGVAVYTVGVAMAQAKKEGDAKKKAAAEARKAARAARRSQGNG
ncbi:MAG: hypothetical protein AAFZ65_10255 [Planctomycetota bacterium]